MRLATACKPALEAASAAGFRIIGPVISLETGSVRRPHDRLSAGLSSARPGHRDGGHWSKQREVGMSAQQRMHAPGLELPRCGLLAAIGAQPPAGASATGMIVRVIW
jgi:hypothetical protein